MNAAVELQGSLEKFRQKQVLAGLFTPEWAEGGDPENTFYLNQIHSGDVHLLSAGDDLNSRPKADAVITCEPLRSLCVRTADCLPILLADHESGWIAAIHGGWRGLQQNIIGNTLGMLADFGVTGDAVSVYIGPSVRSCCYCVSEEMKAVFDNRYFSDRSDGLFLDLHLIAADQLRQAGVRSGSVIDSGICSKCCTEIPSVRRQGSECSRMTSWVCRK